MKRTITILLSLLIVMLALASCKKDSDTYKMPYEPGVTVDNEGFLSHKKLWDTAAVKNYSYTYFFHNRNYPSENCKIDVTVKDGKVNEYKILEFDKMPVAEIPESEEGAYKEFCDSVERSNDFLLIDEIYSSINKTIENSIKKFEEYPDCYYADYSFDFSEEAPFLSRCFYKVLLMQEDLVGNGATIEIKIENFTEN